MKLLIITGMSGAGKSLAANSIEDMGYYCVDNIPPSIIPSFVSLSEMGREELSRIAVVTDIRGGKMLNELPKVIEELKAKNVYVKILFIDASDDAIKKRYRIIRRLHPLCEDSNISVDEAVNNERKMLSEIKGMSDFVIDTTDISPYNLKSEISRIVFGHDDEGFKIVCRSFGFKNGFDGEADLVYDVRCLPNPFYVDGLKNLTGLTKPVNDYIFSFEESNEYKNRLLNFLDFSVPLYVKEGKSRLVISFGCTGGKHRSVAFAKLTAQYLAEKGYKTATVHRDMEK